MVLDGSGIHCRVKFLAPVSRAGSEFHRFDHKKILSSKSAEWLAICEMTTLGKAKVRVPENLKEAIEEVRLI